MDPDGHQHPFGDLQRIGVEAVTGEVVAGGNEGRLNMAVGVEASEVVVIMVDDGRGEVVADGEDDNGVHCLVFNLATISYSE